MICFFIKREYLPNRIIISAKEMHIHLEPPKLLDPMLDTLNNLI